MSQAVADAVKHLPRIAVNTTYELARDAEVIYASDAPWWQSNPGALECAGLKASVELRQGIAPVLPAGVQVLRNTGTVGFDATPGCLRTQNNSGGAAIHVAAQAGAARILLLGFDMRGGRWHGKGRTKPETYGRWVAMMGALAAALRARRVEVLNCTRGSALRCFPIASLDAALEWERVAA